MAVICEELVRAINSGKCFALVGAGASCDLGLPTPKQLCELVLADLVEDEVDVRSDGLRKLLDKGDYPKFFSFVEKAIGLERLAALVDQKLSGEWPKGQIYKHIAAWPFQSYMTTNFDDQMTRHLEDIGSTFVTRLNSQRDLQLLHSTTRDIVFKIHGDATVPNDMVLTEEQYAEFRKGDEREYWRENVFSLLNMVDIVTIGYSASDPDFQDQLKRLEGVASPDHPVFMFATGFDETAIAGYFRDYNIRIIPYDNSDGTHSNLRRVLARYDPFIAKRDSPFVGLQSLDEDAASLASSIYLFTQLRLGADAASCFERSYAAVLLDTLSRDGQQEPVSTKQLASTVVQRTSAAVDVDPVAFNQALDYLHNRGLVSASDGNLVMMLPAGRTLLDKVSAERELLEERFRKSCLLVIQREHPTFGDEIADTIVTALREGLVRAFETRGMELAGAVFHDDQMDISDATDILRTIERVAGRLREDTHRAAFADLMIQVILQPSKDMRDYMAAMCQGYFAYHALGLEPRSALDRLEMARGTKWIADSSVILPLLAIDCVNHSYATDLIEKMKDLELKCCTTKRLFDEVKDHAWWAIKNFKDVQYGSTELLHVAMAGPGYKENLFISGFAKWGATSGRPTLNQYMCECLGPEYSNNLGEAIAERVSSLGITIHDPAAADYFSTEHRSEIDRLSSEIAELRNRLGTYRSEAQCDAEAEALLTCSRENAVFISPSNVLNKMHYLSRRASWNPEAMYRFLALFSSIDPESQTLYQCMTQTFFTAGFDIVDKESISNYTAPLVRQARMILDQERDAYRAALGQDVADRLYDHFEQVPDEHKPFYSMQFAFYVARAETAHRKKAEKRTSLAEESKKLTEKERKELEHLKVKADEKRRKREKRKRRTTSRGRGRPKKGRKK